MIRRLLTGAIALSTLAFAARQLGALARDLNRYNAMREMSGDPPLFRSEIRKPFNPRATNASAHQTGLFSFVASSLNDMLRYARISAM